MQPNNNNNSNNSSVIEVIIDETTPLLPINFSPISTSTSVDDGSEFYRPWSPSDQYEVISLSSDENNPNSSSRRSSSDCPSLESISIPSNNEIFQLMMWKF